MLQATTARTSLNLVVTAFCGLRVMGATRGARGVSSKATKGGLSAVDNLPSNTMSCRGIDDKHLPVNSTAIFLRSKHVPELQAACDVRALVRPCLWLFALLAPTPLSSTMQSMSESETVALLRAVHQSLTLLATMLCAAEVCRSLPCSLCNSLSRHVMTSGSRRGKQKRDTTRR